MKVASRQDNTPRAAISGGAARDRLRLVQRVRAVGLLLRDPFFLVLLRFVMADDAAADCPYDGVVARIVTGNAAHDRAFHAAGGVCGSGCG